MRARNLKPGLFSNEVLGAADPLYTVTYAGLWCRADCEGRLEDRPARIHIEVNPFRDVGDTERSLAWLAETSHIVRYEVAGVRYIAIPTFRKHQSPHHKELTKGSSIPPPPAFSAQTGTGLGPEREGTASGRSDSGIRTPDVLKPSNGLLTADCGSLIADSHGNVSSNGSPHRSHGGSVATADQLNAAQKALRDPKHKNFTDHEIATVAHVPKAVVQEARRQAAT